MNDRSSPTPPPPPRRPLRPPREEVASRARTYFGLGYLTLTGVTQSVALAVLAMRVEATYTHFGFVNWILVVNTFLLTVIIWNEYLILTIAYLWTPTVVDALIPFTLFALQVFVAHNVYPDQRAWLTALGAVFAAGTVAFGYGFFQAARHDTDNRDILRAIGVHQSLTMVSTAVGCGLCWGAALLYEAAKLGQARAVIALAASLAVVVTVLRSIPYWNRVKAYAGLRPGRANAAQD
jgi:hypothetical protein